MAKEPSLGQGIRRIAAVLQAVGRGPRAGLRLTDIAAETGLNKATVHRLLSGLGQAGYIEQDDDTGRFHLGLEIFVLGSMAARRYGLEEIAHPFLARLEAKSSDTTYLSVRSGYDAVCLDRCEGSYPVKVLTLNVGDRRPLGIGGGALTLLAFMADDEIERAIEANRAKLANYPTVDVPRLYGLIETTRKQGYAFFDGFVVPEMSSIGMPVRGPDGTVVAAIAMSAIRDRMKGDRHAQLVEMLAGEVKALQARLAELQPHDQALTRTAPDDTGPAVAAPANDANGRKPRRTPAARRPRA